MMIDTQILHRPGVSDQGGYKARFSLLKHAAMRVVCAILFLCMSGVCIPRASAEEDEKVNQMKAAFIYNFIKYVRWPKSAQRDVFKVGVLGEDPLVKPLQELAEKRKVKGRRLEVNVFADEKAMAPCSILFISAAHVGVLDSLREELEDSHVLLIGDTEGLAGERVAVNFVVAKERLRFEISQKALDRAKLGIGAQMLKLAILVDKE